MKTVLKKIGASVAWVWRQVSALVAVVLILVAGYVGYRLGAPDQPEEVQEEHAAHTDEVAEEPTLYTCSMHPSVRLPDPDAKCPICFMDLIPVTEDAGGSSASLVLSEAAAAASRIETAKAAEFFPTAEVRLYGKLTYDETSVARLTAYFPARIDRLFVNYVGVPVARGDHLAEVYSPELLAAFEELRQALRAADESRTSSELVRSATQDTLAAAREKLRLFGLTDEQVMAVEDGSFGSDRLTVYSPIGGIVTHLAAREGDYVGTGEPIATVANLSRLWLDLEAYESQMPLLRWGQPVEFTVESHPGERFEGRISFIEPIVDERTRTAAVRVAVDNADGRLKPGMFASAVVRPRVAADGAVVSDELAGRWVSPMHPTVVKDGPGECDVCGMDLVPAESLGVVGDPEAAVAPLVIPRSAVLFTGTRSVVYVEEANTDRPTYEAREVTLGARAGEFYVVREGLEPSEAVVVSGAFRIDSAMGIAAKPSMMVGEPSGGSSREGSGGAGDVPIEFVHSLKPVYAAYLDAQESLADDDLEGYLQAERDLGSAVGLVEAHRLVGEPLGAWRRAAASLRTDAPATTIDEARSRFEQLSRGVVQVERRFGHHGSDAWHLAYCPMAFENEGAEWMQRGEEIDNPYFGASMLRCGEVLESFAPLNAASGSVGGHGHD